MNKENFKQFSVFMNVAAKLTKCAIKRCNATMIKVQQNKDVQKSKFLAATTFDFKKKKEYKDAKPLHDKARVRLLHFLNNEADYINRMKQSTKDKYKFRQENGRWV